ncbi:MAG: hypothetical protein CME61_00315 [Halobacteriovoraceae bacterium]|nr:hypothetical protein [Halobacteriovoraceae bacterium]
MAESPKNTPKALKQGTGSNFIIPLAIVLIGSLIIFGVTKMLENDRGYKDLVRDLHSKTFGNRWIAAFELSKVISAKKIPSEDVPWLIENLEDLYSTAVDFRTKNFIIVALGSLGDSRGVPTIQKGLVESDSSTQFHSVVALGGIKDSSAINFRELESLLSSSDEVLKQAVILTVSTHQYHDAIPKLREFLRSESASLRYAAATGLINFKDEQCAKTVQEILTLNLEPDTTSKIFDQDKVQSLKFNVINALRKQKWTKFNQELRQIIDKETNLKIVAMSRELLDEFDSSKK